MNVDSALLTFKSLVVTWHTSRFNIKKLYNLATMYFVYFIYLRTNSDFCPISHKQFGFYNRDEKCLLRGTNWVFK
jgi:hypothetical protein